MCDRRRRWVGGVSWGQAVSAHPLWTRIALFERIFECSRWRVAGGSRKTRAVATSNRDIHRATKRLPDCFGGYPLFEGRKSSQIPELSHHEIPKERATLKIAELFGDSKKELAARHEEFT